MKSPPKPPRNKNEAEDLTGPSLMNVKLWAYSPRASREPDQEKQEYQNGYHDTFSNGEREAIVPIDECSKSAQN